MSIDKMTIKVVKISNGYVVSTTDDEQRYCEDKQEVEKHVSFLLRRITS